MDINKLKLELISQKNEAVDSLVNGSLENLAEARYLQGHIHRIDKTLLLIKQLTEEKDDPDDE